MKHAVPRPLWTGLLAGMAALLLLVGSGRLASTQELPGQHGLVSADPAPNARLADAPDRIALNFAVPVDAGSARIRLVRNGASVAQLQPPDIDPANPARVTARMSGPPGGGDYVVLWSARTAEGGALVAGAYPFQAGVVENPGAAQRSGESPAPWAVILRWLVFLGTALAAGWFGWASLVSSGSRSRAPGTLPRGSLMTGGTIVALLATLLAPLIGTLPGSPGGTSLASEFQRMPQGWWLQTGALVVLTMICLISLRSVGGSAGMPRALGWWGLGCGLLALIGLGFTSHAATPLDGAAMVLEVGHLWSAALWLAGLVYLLGGWRTLGTDVARFRLVRWVGGVLFGVAIATGAAGAWQRLPAASDLVLTRYGQVLSGKSAVVLIILALGLLGMVLPRRSNANRASGSLGAQVGLAFIAALLAAALALMAPGRVAPSTLAGVDLVEVIPLDANAFGSGSGVVHLLTQPGRPGPQTVVVRIEDLTGLPLTPEGPPDVQVTWTPLADSGSPGVTVPLSSDDTGTLFAGAFTFEDHPWWQADVAITPPGGIAGRARFIFVLPDPNIAGRGPANGDDPQARALFARGLDALDSLDSVRFTRNMNDGSGRLVRSRGAVSIATTGVPARYSEATVDSTGRVISEQRIIGDERWILEREEGWTEAPPQPAPTPAGWGEGYLDATGFQLGPREEIDGELCQIVTFQQPAGQDASRAPAWSAWWVDLASSNVRRIDVISPGRYESTIFSGFGAPLSIEPPPLPRTPPARATPTSATGTAAATPTR